MVVYFLSRFIKSLKSPSEEWLYATCGSSYFFGTFIIKQFVGFSLKFLGTTKQEKRSNEFTTSNK